ncbi:MULTISPECIES: STAS domain-containing protein [unclassified Bacillus (in: firmicutes)]|uniref:STAS domain-containing protein n=1 Tax=unclassified Bacillus (in: firmicutes) TaxID=185979 RepID=UPI0008E66D22|nr:MULTISPECIES: STAS domain-containing protein [unclassified Bacillus (in: firmicutes)]SFB21892.1 rsbT co-antagonist protein RsbR [Bacillus sp. UNCCL13]SFQ91050.1 rsbT co-antagonist protein RsbR [Bacillus sp. cl95]
MQYFEHQLPLPYIKIDKQGNIISYSYLARETFDLSDAILTSIVDEESVDKLVKHSLLTSTVTKMELNMKTKLNPLALFEIHINWDISGYGHILFIAKDSSNLELIQKVMFLQQRIATTDFELFEKKEEIEHILIRLNELSGPFIPLSDSMCFIPIFGDITEEKIHVISDNCLQSVFAGEYEEIFFDFTAVGEVHTSGIEKLTRLLKTLFFMTGGVIKVIGLKPNLVKILHHYKIDEFVDFDHSLSEVLKEHYK